MQIFVGATRSWAYLAAGPAGEPALLTFALDLDPAKTPLAYLLGARAPTAPLPPLPVTVQGVLAGQTYNRLMDSGPGARVSVQGEVTYTDGVPELAAAMVRVA